MKSSGLSGRFQKDALERDPQADAARSNAQIFNDPEATLRLLAQVEPPRGLQDRIHSRIEKAAAETSGLRVRRFWGFWLPVRRLEFAGAAILALGLATSIWSIHRVRIGPVTTYPPNGPSTPFGSAGASGHPRTLEPIKVPPFPRKKPSASKLKPESRTDPKTDSAVESQRVVNPPAEAPRQ